MCLFIYQFIHLSAEQNAALHTPLGIHPPGFAGFGFMPPGFAGLQPLGFVAGGHAPSFIHPRFGGASPGGPSFVHSGFGGPAPPIIHPKPDCMKAVQIRGAAP